jgi:D-alanyl-D-alanine carboxypeptidase/D-alanyl-D-alanine-endopeptidase (penicillin-binding protein 4)
VVRLKNTIATTAKKGDQSIILDLPPGGDTLKVSGKIWKDSGGYPGEVAVPDPTAYFGDLFRRALVRHGVSVDGGIVRGPGRASKVAKPVVFATHDTPLMDLVGTTNRRSQNLFAECLLKNLGYEKRKQGSFAGGARVTAGLLAGLGFGPEAFVQQDGSGLSRGNRVSALALTKLLAKLYATKARNPFILTLPTGGDAEGSLRKRMKDLGVNVAAKTGTIDGVSALAGFVRARSGRMLCFAVLDNGVKWKGHPPATARKLQDDLCRLLHRRF